MTVAITYRNKYVNDMDNATEWGAEGLNNMAAGDASILSDGDVLVMTGVTDNVAQQEWFYHELDISDVTANYCTVRFKTSDSSAGMQAYVYIDYGGGNTQSIYLGYSQSWKVTTTALTRPTDSVDRIRIYCYEEAAANPNASHYVYYDWIMLHNGTFTFPHVAPGGVSVNLPMKIAKLDIPGRSGGILQNLGQDSAEITIRGDILEGETWRSNALYTEFDYFIQSLTLDSWCYLTCDRPLIRCQVMYRGLTFETVGDNMKMQWELHFYIYKLNSYSDTDFTTEVTPPIQWLWSTT